MNENFFLIFRIRELCSSHPAFGDEGLRLVGTIELLLKHLLEYREVRNARESKEGLIMATVSLLVKKKK